MMVADLGSRIELRPVHRQLSHDQRAGDARVRRSPRHLSRRTLRRAEDRRCRPASRPPTLKGSWAGAMGQPQFMPSSYLRHAVDFDSDGRDRHLDIARRTSSARWQTTSGTRAGSAGERWGREVTVSRTALAKIDRRVADAHEGLPRRSGELTVAGRSPEWAKLGVTLTGGSALPNGPTPGVAGPRPDAATSSSTGTTKPSSPTTARMPTRSAWDCWLMQ